MRDISSEYMNLLGPVRRIGARMTFRDTRLLFERFGGASLLGDSCTARGIFRVAMDDGTLKYQYIQDPTAAWPAWQTWSYGDLAECKPGCINVDNDVHIIALKNYGGEDTFIRVVFDTENQTLGEPQQLGVLSADHQSVGIAPVAEDEFYYQYFPYTDTREVNYATICHSGGTSFDGAVYGDMADALSFDAVRLDGVDYVFTSDNDLGRPVMFKVRSGWSDAFYVLPLDVLDDTSYLALGGVEVINGQIFLTGRLKRGSNIEMEIYMFGDDGNFSIGRDMYIGNSEEFPNSGGKLLFTHGYVWYVGLDLAKAPATMLVGYENKEKMYATKDAVSFAVSNGISRPMSLTSNLKSDMSHPAIRKSSSVTLDVGLQDQAGDWEWAQIGEFGVDGLVLDYFDAGIDLVLAGRAMASKRLAQWTSDAFYDYWSQAKSTTNPADLEKVIRATGFWSTDELFEQDALEGGELPIRLDKLNDMGILYSTAKSSRNGEAVAKFWSPENVLPPHKMHGRFGVGINYYRESKGEAAERLGKETEDVTEEDYGDNGIFAVIGPEEHSGEGIALYFVKDGVWTKIYSESYAYAKNSWIWMMIRFNEGAISVYVANTYESPLFSSEIVWEEKFSLRFDLEYEPWARDQRGRGALLVQNVSVYSITPGFTSTSTVIPVESIADFPSADTVIVDSEIIDYDGRRSVDVYPGELTWSDGVTWLEADHDNPDWNNVLIHSYPWIEDHAGEQILGESRYSNLFALMFYTGPNSGQNRIDRIRLVVKRVGTPKNDLWVAIVNDDWDNNSPPAQGVGRFDTPIVTAVAHKPWSQIPTEYDWVEFDFSDVPEKLRWLWYPYRINKGYAFIVGTLPFYFVSETVGYKYRTDWTSYSQSSHYYYVKVDKAASTTSSVFAKWGTSGWTKSRDRTIPYEIYGIGNMPSGGFEIYFDEVGPDLSKDYYNDMALVVTEGPGKGNVFQISGYDKRAPMQWETSRTYLAPDTMEAHVGDLEHGSWVDYDLSRAIVTTSPKGIVGEGSKFVIYPSLLISERGTQETVASAHGSGKVSIYSDLSVACQEMRFFSGEMDMRFEDMAREICAKSGVHNFSASKSYDGSVSGVQWMSEERRHAIVKFTRTTETAGLIIRASSTDLDAVDTSYYKFFVGDTVDLYIKRSGEYTDTRLESFPVSAVGNITMSVQEETFSLWVDDSHLVSFSNSELSTGENNGFYSSGTTDIEWSSLDMRVDNYVLDLGSRGAQLLTGLIGPKTIAYRDTSDGGIYMERIKVSGEPEYTLSDLTVEASRATMDGALVNRVRAEGAEIAEVIDWNSFREDGNLFTLVNATEANDEWETASEGRFILGDSRSQVETHVLVGACDPRVEPNDIIRGRVVDGYHDVIIDTANFSMQIAEDGVNFDMHIEGRDATG